MRKIKVIKKHEEDYELKYDPETDGEISDDKRNWGRD